MRLPLSLSSNHLFFLSPKFKPPFSITSSILPKMADSGNSSLIWFRKGLRIHDNPALEHAANGSDFVYPVFVIDPHYMEPDPDAFSPGSSRAGVNRIKFLLESLVDLDCNLKKIGSRLLVFKGEPGDVLTHCLKQWNIKKLCFEYDTDPYYQDLSARVEKYASQEGIEVFSPVSHTLFDPRAVIAKNGGKPPLTYQSFLKVAGQPTWASSPVSTGPSSIPPPGDIGDLQISNVPTMEELGYLDVGQHEFSPFKGGEFEALKRLKQSLDDKAWVAKFEKPKGNPSSFLKPATTVLSPYLKFGCISSRYFYQCIQEVYKSVKQHTSPPVSLLGQIPWNEDSELLAAWRDGRTGFINGVGCTILHGIVLHASLPVFIHWEKGRDVFERLLIDSDWSINNGNWLWLSCSSFFYEYHRIYSPISFGKKHDPNGDFIRHFLPVLKDMPKQYIYEPWTAPKSLQVKAKCIIGKDYPSPVVSHDSASKECKRKLAEAYALNRQSNGSVSEDDLGKLRRKLEEDQQTQKPAAKKQKQKLITD
uniref:Photolyase/cryptochrome alpha/beta domain-containing protein n=1 Tax=Chenopodium quinoa TaxID=63459 RepID=A0A803LEG8_CHEQI